MGEEGHGGLPGQKSGCGGEGISILLSEERMYSFMEDGDFSSSRDLEHFSTIAAGLEKKISGTKGFSLLALSMGESRITRDFSVLQIAHLLARHGKKTLIVDCDFISPGLSGLVPDVESHGFLDLLLYGSSLKSVTAETGIENVSVTGPGSFPVSRTIPFALKEFGKVRDFLAKSCDVVIYCTTLYTDDGAVNPMAPLVDSLLLCCRIDEMREGELEKRLGTLGTDIPGKDLLCFCDSPAGEQPAPAPSDAPEEEADVEEEEILELDPESEIQEPVEDDEMVEPVFIEKSEEIDSIRQEKKGGINIVRLVSIGVIVIVASFLIWWFLTERAIREQEGSDKMTELVAKQQDARDQAARTGVADSTTAAEVDAAAEESVSGTGEVADDTTAVKEPPAEEPQAAAGTVSGGGEAAEVSKREEPREEYTYAPEGKYYSIHIASFRDMARAGTEADYFEGKGYDVRVLEVSVNGEPWFRVYIGEFEAKEEAEELRRQLLDIRRVGYTKIVLLSYQGRDGS